MFDLLDARPLPASRKHLDFSFGEPSFPFRCTLGETDQNGFLSPPWPEWARDPGWASHSVSRECDWGKESAWNDWSPLGGRPRVGTLFWLKSAGSGVRRMQSKIPDGHGHPGHLPSMADWWVSVDPSQADALPVLSPEVSTPAASEHPTLERRWV